MNTSRPNFIVNELIDFSLCTNLLELRLGYYFDHLIGTLPPSLKYLMIGRSLIPEIKKIYPNIQVDATNFY